MSPDGIIRTVAGGGNSTSIAENVSATSVALQFPSGIAVDGQGNLYIAERGRSNSGMRTAIVSACGRWGRTAGSQPRQAPASWGYSGDGGPALEARLVNPGAMAVDGAGKLYFSQTLGVRKVSSGKITTVAGTLDTRAIGDGGQVADAIVEQPDGLGRDRAGNLYIAEGHRIRKVTPAGVISTIAGVGAPGYGGDGGAATAAHLNYPSGIAVAEDGTIYFADKDNNRVRKISPGGVIGTVAGDPGMASVGRPSHVVLDTAGNIYFNDTSNNLIRKVDRGGASTVFAGGGPSGALGDGKVATSATLNDPQGLVSIARVTFTWRTGVTCACGRSLPEGSSARLPETVRAVTGGTWGTAGRRPRPVSAARARWFSTRMGICLSASSI